MFDFFGIKESLSNAYTRMSEMVFPILNDLQLTLYGTNYNPFEVGSLILRTFVFLYIIIIFVLGGAFIITNLNKLNSKQTLRKSILILVFIMIGVVVAVNIENKGKIKPFNLNLVYIGNQEDSTIDDAVIETNKGYIQESVNSIYNANTILADNENGSKYLTFNIESFSSGDNTNLSDIYLTDASYKNYIVGINPIYLEYKDFIVKNSFFSNLDLFGIPYTSIDQESLGEMSNLDNSHKFDETTFPMFLDMVYLSDISGKYKSSILDDKEKGAYINYQGRKYIFAGQYDDPKYSYKSDLIFSYENPKNNAFDYVVVPYYDVITFINPNYKGLKTGALSLLIRPGDDKESEDSSEIEISDRAKQKYIELKLLLENSFEDIDKIKDLAGNNNAITDYQNGLKNEETLIELVNIDDQKIKYIATFNQLKGNEEIYDTSTISEYAKKELIEINLGLKKLSKAKLATATADEIDSEQAQKLLTFSDSLHRKYVALIKNELEGTSTSDSVLGILGVAGKAPSEGDALSGTGSGSIENLSVSKIESFQNKIEDTISNVKIADSILNDKEKELIEVLKKLDILNEELPTSMKFVNTKNEPLFTLVGFFQKGNDVGFKQGSYEAILSAFCEDGKKIPEVFEKFDKQGNTIGDDIINCEFENGAGRVIEPDKLKDILDKSISLDIESKFASESTDIIPYLGSIGNAKNTISSIYSTGEASEIRTEFLVNRVKFGNYSFISPLVYYNALLNNKTNNVPGVFVNLIPIDGHVYTPKGVYNMKIGEVNSWYRDIDSVNGAKYSKKLNFGFIPLAHHLPLIVLLIITQFAYVCFFLLLIQVFTTLLNVTNK